MSYITILNDYLNFLKTVKGLSKSTIQEYKYDLETFLKYQIMRKYPQASQKKMNNLDISLDENDKNIINNIIDARFLQNININDFYQFLSYLDNEKNDIASTRSRKIAALRSFFSYLYSDIEIIDKNITSKLKSPKLSKRHPVYFTLNETKMLLNTVNLEKNEFLRLRDYAIIFTFLSTGMRLSELASLNIDDLQTEYIKVLGKGNKERFIYLSDACEDVINNYICIRNKILNDKVEKALFISTRKRRLSNRAIQHMMQKYLKKAGFNVDVYSVHKLRHTAATLMYRYGNVDIRTLQSILGHESVATTQIYTHIENTDLKKALENNPISNLKI